MSFAGQWIGKYSGTNEGRMVVDIDDRGSYYSGFACAWDADPRKPSVFAGFATNDKAPLLTLNDLPITPIDSAGNFIPANVVDQWIAAGLLSRTATVSFQKEGDALKVNWSTPIGTEGCGHALVPHTRAGNPSELNPSAISTWADFKEYVGNVEPGRFVYRGQESNAWRLRTSFHRTGRVDLSRYCAEDLPDLHKYIAATAHRIFDFGNRLEYASFVTLAQHHGYPTPLLDWTWSPYVAAYFAYFNIKDSSTPGKMVRIFKLDLREWGKLIQADKISPVPPHLSVLDGLAVFNPRVVPQQSISTYTNVDDIETHIRDVGAVQNKAYIEAFDLPIGQRNSIVAEVDLMGINAGSLFPGVDGVCASIRERRFNRKS